MLAEEYGLHDDDPDNPFYPMDKTIKTLFLLAFAGDFEPDVFGTLESFVLPVRPRPCQPYASTLPSPLTYNFCLLE